MSRQDNDSEWEPRRKELSDWRAGRLQGTDSQRNLLTSSTSNEGWFRDSDPGLLNALTSCWLRAKLSAHSFCRLLPRSPCCPPLPPFRRHYAPRRGAATLDGDEGGSLSLVTLVASYPKSGVSWSADESSDDLEVLSLPELLPMPHACLHTHDISTELCYPWNAPTHPSRPQSCTCATRPWNTHVKDGRRGICRALPSSARRLAWRSAAAFLTEVP